MAKRNDGFAEEGISLYPDRTRAHLKIQEGCDFRCSYCIVPTARGPARSRAWDDVLREADALLAEGYRELVLTGVNIATYRDKDRTLDSLCEALLQRNPSFRLRLSSTEPGPVLTDVVALMAENSRLCRFLHIPLQYGEDRILALMNRRYTVEQYSATVNAASEKIPGLCVGSDIIVGFPGETDEIFQACCKTVEVLPINHVHVFTYSKRAGTVAATLPHQVPGNFASERSSILKRICDRKADTFAASQIGRTLTVLTEERNSRGRWEGWSDNYLRVEIESTGEAGLGDNQLIPVLIDGMEDDRLLRGHAQNH
jgi:threonylcarbamoyladenosine tRNA methylthiotransferase MtaB